MSSPVVVVLPCVPATASTREPAITAASPAERGRIRRPRRCASSTSGLSSRAAVVTTSGVGVADVGGVVAEVAGDAELAQRGQERGVVVVAAGDGDAAPRP